MAHLLSITFFASVLAGLAMLLHRSLWDGRSAIRSALFAGGNQYVPLPETALHRLGTCLRVSFPPIAGAPNDEMDRLLAHLHSRAGLGFGRPVRSRRNGERSAWANA